MSTDEKKLTSNDPEPPLFTVVRAVNLLWTRYPEGWVAEIGGDGSDPETWRKVAGNYGPAVVVGPAQLDQDSE